MPEVPDTGRDKGNAILIAAVNGVLVSQAAAGVRDGRDTSLACLLDRVVPGERKEGVTGHHGALHMPNSFNMSQQTSMKRQQRSC